MQWSSSAFTRSLLLTLKGAQKKGVKLGRSHYILWACACVWVCVVSSNCTQDMYTGLCCGFLTLSPWSPAGMSPLITHPASAVACCGLCFCLDVKSICPTTKVKPAKMPTLAIYHVATPPLGSSIPSYIFFLTGLSHLILRLMIQWPIVSALPDDPVSASFISCKKWTMFPWRTPVKRRGLQRRLQFRHNAK